MDLYLIKFQRHVTKYFCSVLQFTRITALTRAPFSALSAQEEEKYVEKYDIFFKGDVDCNSY